jgi:hypothetical protein
MRRVIRGGRAVGGAERQAVCGDGECRVLTSISCGGFVAVDLSGVWTQECSS